MSTFPRTVLAAAVVAALASGRAAAQDPAAEPSSPSPAEPAAPAGDDFGAKTTTTLNPIPQLEPVPLLAAEGPAGENVWSHGVPQAERLAADELFQSGNKLLRESLTILAVTKYREALTHWNHPNIHFNLAIGLMSLDQPVETYEHLQQATKYGAKPLEQERYEHARNYMVLLEKQLARVRVACDVPKGVVELDGHQLFETPGEWNGLVRAGKHTLVARRDGYVTNQSVRMWEGGQTVAIRLDLKTADELTERTRRWSAWKPWVVVGGGLAVLAGGAALTAGGNQMISDYERGLRACTPSSPCSRDEGNALRRKLKDGQKTQQMGVVGAAAGGAVLLTGAVLVFMNRGTTHLRTYDSGETLAPPPAAPPTVELSPLVTPDAPGLAVRVRF